MTGALTQNTLGSAPNPVVTENVNVGDKTTGTVKVASNRQFTQSGYVNTSRGKVTTTISQSINFVSFQKFNVSGSIFAQNINQLNTVGSTTSVSTAGQPSVTTTRRFEFPLNMSIVQAVQSNGDLNQTTASTQAYNSQTTTMQNGAVTWFDLLTNEVSSHDTLMLDAGFNLLGNTNQASAQTYYDQNSQGKNYLCILTATKNALASFSPTCSQ